MLLHKLYINVAIANVLRYPKILHELPGPKCKKWRGPKIVVCTLTIETNINHSQ